MRASALFSAKNLGFFEIMVCPHGQSKIESCEHFVDKVERGQFFITFTDEFYRRPSVLAFVL